MRTKDEEIDLATGVRHLVRIHGGVQRKYGGKKFSKDMALLFAFYKSIPRHRAIKLNNRPINTLSLFVIQGDAASDLRSDFFQSHCHF